MSHIGFRSVRIVESDINTCVQEMEFLIRNER